jgi:ParB family protein of integrating conjugative element (PFGI_1 class)
MSTPKKLTADEIMAKARARGQTQQPVPQTPAISDGTKIIRLRVADVDAYEGNPRTEEHADFDGLLGSIRADGISQLLTVTQRPSNPRHVLHSGGGTRLKALKILSLEEPEKFEFYDFVYKPYTTESDILAAHLAENIQRANMTFWDTAKGITKMRFEREHETGQTLSSREFEQYLKQKGLATSNQTLQLYEFSVEKLSGLGSQVQKVAREHVLRLLRPVYANLQALWLKHAGRTEDDFSVAYKHWVTLYPSLHTEYKADDLNDHLQANAAQDLGYTVDELEVMISALETNPKADLADLMSPRQTAQAVPPVSVATDQGLANLAATLGGASPAATSASFESDSEDSEDSEDDYTPPSLPPRTQSPSSLRVAHGLKPDGLAGSSTTDSESDEQPQNELPGVTFLDSAFQQVRGYLLVIADIAAVTSYVTDAPNMPYGYFMEIPLAGVLGDGRDELPVQAWWFLANLSGQLNLSMLETKDAHGHSVLPETGEAGFRHVMANEDLWPLAVAESLGGESLLEVDFAFGILTDPTHPLGEAAIALVGACRSYNLAKINGGRQ